MQPIFHRVDTIDNGWFAVMGRPRSGDYADEEFAALAESGISMIVSLLEHGEAYEVGLSNEQELCDSAGIEFKNFAIPDRGIPLSPVQFGELSHSIYRRTANGEATAIHCRAGIGRSGLLAAAVLLHHGIEADEAFRIISAARGVEVPDTPEQSLWLRQNASTILEAGCA